MMYKDLKSLVSQDPFLKLGATDFMRLWEAESIYKIYEIVLISVAIREKVHWKQIYNFSPNSPYYPQLCVAVLLIYDALKFISGSNLNRDCYMQPHELEIVKSYSLK